MRRKVIMLFCFFCLYGNCISQTWEELDGIEYYYDPSDNGVANYYNDAVDRCDKLDATIVIIKSPKVENFILSLPSISELPVVVVIKICEMLIFSFKLLLFP